MHEPAALPCQLATSGQDYSHADLPRCQSSKPFQQPQPRTARKPIATSSAVSVILRRSSIRRRFQYFTLTALASSSASVGCPLLGPDLPFSRKSSDSLRPSWSNFVGVTRGLPHSSAPGPFGLRSPLCRRNGGAGRALIRLNPSSSASVPLSLGDCDSGFLRLRLSTNLVWSDERSGDADCGVEGSEGSGVAFQSWYWWR